MINYKYLLFLALALAYSSDTTPGCGFAGDWGGGWYSSGNLWAGWAYDGPYRRFNGPINHDKAISHLDDMEMYQVNIQILDNENKQIQKNKHLSSSEKAQKIAANKHQIKDYQTLMNILEEKQI